MKKRFLSVALTMIGVKATISDSKLKVSKI